MSKKALVDQIEPLFDSKAKAEAAIDAVFGGVEAILRRGEPVQLRGFGTFKPKKREARMGRNPSTGESIKIAPRTVMVLESKIQL